MVRGYEQRVHGAVESALRGLVKRTYWVRRGREQSRLKGVPFRNRRERIQAAERAIGFAHDELFGASLPDGAALVVGSAADVTEWTTRSEDGNGELSVFTALERLHVSEAEVARVAARARDRVRKSNRVIRAERTLAAVGSTASSPDDWAASQALVRGLASRHRRRLSHR